MKRLHGQIQRVYERIPKDGGFDIWKDMGTFLQLLFVKDEISSHLDMQYIDYMSAELPNLIKQASNIRDRVAIKTFLKGEVSYKTGYGIHIREINSVIEFITNYIDTAIARGDKGRALTKFEYAIFKQLIVVSGQLIGLKSAIVDSLRLKLEEKIASLKEDEAKTILQEWIFSGKKFITSSKGTVYRALGQNLRVEEVEEKINDLEKKAEDIIGSTVGGKRKSRRRSRSTKMYRRSRSQTRIRPKKDKRRKSRKRSKRHK